MTACGENTFGWDCEHQCGSSAAVPACFGGVFCMPDPVGCSCMTGYTGAECVTGNCLYVIVTAALLITEQ